MYCNSTKNSAGSPMSSLICGVSTIVALVLLIACSTCNANLVSRTYIRLGGTEPGSKSIRKALVKQCLECM